jgi:hypothetical protein
MDSKLILVKCMSLLFREAELGKINLSLQLCKDLLESIKTPETSFEIPASREALIGLRATLVWMIDKSNEPYDLIQLQQRLRINTRDDTYLYHAFVDATQPIDEEGLKKQILLFRKELTEQNNAGKIQKILMTAWQKSNFMNDNFEDQTAFIRSVNAELEPYVQNLIEKGHPSLVDSLDFDNEEEIERVLKQSQEEMSTLGVLRTGWQGINRMLGETGGFRRGEFAVIGALPHNYKTGFVLNLFKHFALYNTPYLRDPEKRPMLLFASLENELPMNIMNLYSNLWENETHQPCNVREVNIREAAAYIRERMSINGYHVEMMRLEPNRCSFQDFFDIITKYESDGYEIHAVICDYLSMMDKRGLDNTGPTGSNIRELFKRVRNFCAPKGITFITPHQLSTEAKVLIRQGSTDFVKEIANKGYYAECRSLDNDPDLEIVMHIERIPGKGSFLTCQRGKHRGVTITPLKHLYTILPFSDVGDVRDDINGRDNSMSDFDQSPSTGTENSEEWGVSIDG